jgi:hypothetical protein
VKAEEFTSTVAGLEFMQEKDEGEDEAFWLKKLVSACVSL